MLLGAERPEVFPFNSLETENNRVKLGIVPVQLTRLIAFPVRIHLFPDNATE